MNSELSHNEKIQCMFQAAYEQHEKGQLGEAYTLYSELLVLEPSHFDALHLSGLIAYQTANPELAIRLISHAIAIKSDDPAITDCP